MEFNNSKIINENSIQQTLKAQPIVNAFESVNQQALEMQTAITIVNNINQQTLNLQNPNIMVKSVEQQLLKVQTVLDNLSLYSYLDPLNNLSKTLDTYLKLNYDYANNRILENINIINNTFQSLKPIEIPSISAFDNLTNQQEELAMLANTLNTQNLIFTNTFSDNIYNIYSNLQTLIDESEEESSPLKLCKPKDTPLSFFKENPLAAANYIIAIIFYILTMISNLDAPLDKQCNTILTYVISAQLQSAANLEAERKHHKVNISKDDDNTL